MCFLLTPRGALLAVWPVPLSGGPVSDAAGLLCRSGPRGPSGLHRRTVLRHHRHSGSGLGLLGPMARNQAHWVCTLWPNCQPVSVPNKRRPEASDFLAAGSGSIAEWGSRSDAPVSPPTVNRQPGKRPHERRPRSPTPLSGRGRAQNVLRGWKRCGWAIRVSGAGAVRVRAYRLGLGAGFVGYITVARSRPTAAKPIKPIRGPGCGLCRRRNPATAKLVSPSSGKPAIGSELVEVGNADCLRRRS